MTGWKQKLPWWTSPHQLRRIWEPARGVLALSGVALLVGMASLFGWVDWLALGRWVRPLAVPLVLFAVAAGGVSVAVARQRGERAPRARASGMSWWVVVAAAAVVAAVGWGATSWLLGEASQVGDTDKKAAARVEAIKTGLGIGAGTTGIFALLLAVRRQQHNESDATEKNVTELYTKAADQLGSAEAPVRLAGLYALERLAHNNPGQRQSIVNVLCAYLRMPFTPPAGQTPPADFVAQLTERQGRVQEREVRLAAQRILFDHLQPAVRQTFWEEIDLDLANAHLIDFTLAGCRVHTASFAGATFTGTARFDHATFTGTAQFDRATFTGAAWFQRAAFTGYAGFTYATFTDAAWCKDATFSDARFDRVTIRVAVFNGANFTGNTWFSNATFIDARFDHATFTGTAEFNGAAFTGYAWFGDATFTDALFSFTTFISAASFTGAAFTRSAYFDLATFTGTAQFDRATFNGTAQFDRATFTGSTRFNDATFNFGATFDRANFTGDTQFNDATFKYVATFDRANFTGDTQFDCATFNGGALLGDSTFTGDANFSGARVTGRDDVVIDAYFVGGVRFTMSSFTTDAPSSSMMVDPREIATIATS